MARNRTIKPEFWTSEQVVSCSTTARLLFIGMWNFCDDYGIHPASTVRLKMEVFPADDINDQGVRSLIGELIHSGLIREYEVEGQSYWIVTGWRHQKIEKKYGRYPAPPFVDHASNGCLPEDDHSTPERKGKGNERNRKGTGTGVFSKLTEQVLRDDESLASWFAESCRVKSPLFSDTDSDRLMVFAAAERAFDVVAKDGGNSVAIFASIVSKPDNRKTITQSQEDRANARLKRLRASPARPNEAVRSLSQKLSCGASGGPTER